MDSLFLYNNPAKQLAKAVHHVMPTNQPRSHALLSLSDANNQALPVEQQQLRTLYNITLLVESALDIQSKGADKKSRLQTIERLHEWPAKRSTLKNKRLRGWVNRYYQSRHKRQLKKRKHQLKLIHHQIQYCLDILNKLSDKNNSIPTQYRNTLQKEFESARKSIASTGKKDIYVMQLESLGVFPSAENSPDKTVILQPEISDENTFEHIQIAGLLEDINNISDVNHYSLIPTAAKLWLRDLETHMKDDDPDMQSRLEKHYGAEVKAARKKLSAFEEKRLLNANKKNVSTERTELSQNKEPQAKQESWRGWFYQKACDTAGYVSSLVYSESDKKENAQSAGKNNTFKR
ncbi:MAG: hypothetical protein DHS20C10_01360 [marine bacterium B5-7]|nr:MAG: hypothetical protein DHS20C10_01360 [marine bacterium B5-7]